jgi:hypothetical protein
VTGNPVAFFDTECYPNYWLLKFRPRGGPVYTFCIHGSESFSDGDIARMKYLFTLFLVVSFNGNGYDIPMLQGVFAGYNAAQLKWLNDRIIPPRIKGQPKVYGAKPWELGLPEWFPADHIDVMEVCPGSCSQKQYAGRIHYKTMRDLPYPVDTHLTPEQIVNVDEYCENDLGQLEAIFDEIAPAIKQRVFLNKKYGIDPSNRRNDLRSKSDAQVAETVLKVECEKVLGHKIYPPDIPYDLKFRYRTPPFIAFQLPQLQQALKLVQESIFGFNAAGNVAMPPQLENLEIVIGQSTYKMGIGGLHSQESKLIVESDENYQILMPDVASYYPSEMLASGEYPPALGPAFAQVFGGIKIERLECKALVKSLKKAGLDDTPEFSETKAGDAGGKIMLNGTFGKTLSAWGILRAPQMGIQTTVTGQLSMLMLIEWCEHYGVPVVSANTDGIVLKCPRHLIDLVKRLIIEWEKRTGLEMEIEEYQVIYARDVNNYFAIKTLDDIKRTGEYAKANMTIKSGKNPDVEICSDAVAEYLARGTPIFYTIAACRDIRKFVTIQKVDGGAVKMWGEGPRKDARVRDMLGTLAAGGWVKAGRQWQRGDVLAPAATAYASCFAPQRPEYLGKVVRWYYGTNSPGPIEYASNGNTVGLSYGATPCMTLPDEFPDDIDYSWYVKKAENILRDLGLTQVNN